MQHQNVTQNLQKISLPTFSSSLFCHVSTSRLISFVTTKQFIRTTEKTMVFGRVKVVKLYKETIQQSRVTAIIWPVLQFWREWLQIRWNFTQPFSIIIIIDCSIDRLTTWLIVACHNTFVYLFSRAKSTSYLYQLSPMWAVVCPS